VVADVVVVTIVAVVVVVEAQAMAPSEINASTNKPRIFFKIDFLLWILIYYKSHYRRYESKMQPRRMNLMLFF
jgi:hypothetical protein